jgi:hypothetical protein
MEKKFYILGSKYARPQSQKAIFVDGTKDLSFRKDIDIELSHWLPNQTDDQYKAGTSTEICFNFLERSSINDYDLVLNNHLDIDGLLASFTLCYPDISLKNRLCLIQAAEMGDFWGYGEGKALILFQNITSLIDALKAQEIDLLDACTLVFKEIKSILLTEPTSNSLLEEAKLVLNSSLSLLKRGEINRTVLHDRFVSYFIPKALSTVNVESYLAMPKFNELISTRLAFWPQVRNKLDKERVQLVIVEGEAGFYYDLWYPPYMWADTRDLWRAPDFIPIEGKEGFYELRSQKLEEATLALNTKETAEGIWVLFKKLSLFKKNNDRGFPIVLSFLSSEGKPTQSNLPFSEVANILARAVER